MYFNSEEKRLRHPQARLIPKDIWENFFSSWDFTQTEIDLMTKSLDELKQSRIMLSQLDNKARSWLAIYYGHPNASASDLIDMGNLMSNTPSNTFQYAATAGSLGVINQLLVRHTPDKVQELIVADCYAAFRTAASHGHLAVLEKFIELAPEKVQEMITAEDYLAFSFTASNGHFAVLEKLIALAPNKVQEMVAANEYYAFRLAAERGHMAVVEKLIELAPDTVQEMIAALEYQALRLAAGRGHFAVVEKLIALAPEKVQEMIAAKNYDAFRWAAKNGHHSVTTKLLSYASVFAYAESHEMEYGENYVRPFLLEKLTNLRELREILRAENPHAVFNLENAEEIELCFYMMRHMIRTNDRAFDDELRFLLEIPAVKALAHTEVTPGQPNELVRLALTTGNQTAAEILLTLPAVRALAEQNNYYRDEAQGQLDIAALARDRESSMHALTTGEQKRLQAAIAQYQPFLNNAGVPHLMEGLREQLRQRYEEKPATITRDDNSELSLPFEYEAFQTLKLSAAEKERAFKAYYQHKDHTAWRYLSKPNYWMAANASYVYVDEANRNLRWSTYEEYQPLITLCWVAAEDEETAPIDGHTMEGRVDHFIDELAHIGRAHNWDKSRVKLDAKGNPQEEEYDDLQGDKPSCFSGVKRRLFQSVVGHPLLKLLTLDDIKQELREFVRHHFEENINDKNREGLKEAYDKYIVETEFEDAAPLKALDISEEKQQQFITQLAQKYGEQFSEEPGFKRYIKEEFTLRESKGKPVDYAHALKFAHFGLDTLLQSPAVSSSSSSSFKARFQSVSSSSSSSSKEEEKGPAATSQKGLG